MMQEGIVKGQYTSMFQLIHGILSIATLIVLVLAAIQAILLLCQDYFLKHPQAGSMNSRFFSQDLESGERRLFQVILIGFLLLTLTIISSVYFFFSMHAIFIIKFSLSFLIWLILASLLWWRYRYGLRGRVAMFATLMGVIIIFVIYIGSLIIL